MQQPMPVIRQLYWPGLIPQIFAVAAFCAVAWFLLPTAHRDQAILFGAAAYLIICRVLRWLLARDHRLGMNAYRAGQFQDAISHFDASYRFFSSHPMLDACRSLLFGVASQNSYRVIALGNMAYCHGQLGEGAKAVELYERVVQMSPEHAVAKASLNLLRAAAPPNGAG